MPTLEYDVREPQGWADAVSGFDQKVIDDGAIVILHGNCPRCQHFMDVELPIALQTGGLTVSVEANEERLERGRGRGAPKSAAFPKTARCNCRLDHEGRPKDVSDGCGAFGALQVG